MEYGHTTGHHVVRSPLSSSLHQPCRWTLFVLWLITSSVKHCSWRNAAATSNSSAAREVCSYSTHPALEYYITHITSFKQCETDLLPHKHPPNTSGGNRFILVLLATLMDQHILYFCWTFLFRKNIISAKHAGYTTGCFQPSDHLPVQVSFKRWS